MLIYAYSTLNKPHRCFILSFVDVINLGQGDWFASLVSKEISALSSAQEGVMFFSEPGSVGVFLER